MNLAVGGHYFLPGLQLRLQPQNMTALSLLDDTVKVTGIYIALYHDDPPPQSAQI